MLCPRTVVRIALVPVCCSVFLLGVQRSNAQPVSSEETVSIDSIRSTWSETRLDPISLVFTVKTEERRREYSADGSSEDSGLGYGAAMTGEHTFRQSSFQETYEFLRAGNQRQALRRIAGTSPFNGDFHPQYAFLEGKSATLTAAPESDAHEDGVVFGSRGLRIPAGLRTVMTYVMLSWIDPATTTDGKTLLELGVKDLTVSTHENFGEVVSVTLPNEATCWYAKRFHWRPIKFMKSRNNKPLLEISYHWIMEGDRVVLDSAQYREVRPTLGEYSNDEFRLKDYRLGAIPLDRFAIDFPPKTVINDGTSGEQRYFIKSENGVEREVQRHERDTAGPEGWAAIVKRDAAPMIQRKDGGYGLYLAGAMLILLVFSMVVRQRFFADRPVER